MPSAAIKFTSIHSSHRPSDSAASWQCAVQSEGCQIMERGFPRISLFNSVSLADKWKLQLPLLSLGLLALLLIQRKKKIIRLRVRRWTAGVNCTSGQMLGEAQPTVCVIFHFVFLPASQTDVKQTARYANHFLLLLSKVFRFLGMNQTKACLLNYLHAHTKAIFKMPLISAGTAQFCLLHIWQKFSVTLKRWLSGRVYRYFCPSHTRSITARLPAGQSNSDALWVNVFIWGSGGADARRALKTKLAYLNIVYDDEQEPAQEWTYDMEKSRLHMFIFLLLLLEGLKM